MAAGGCFRRKADTAESRQKQGPYPHPLPSKRLGTGMLPGDPHTLDIGAGRMVDNWFSNKAQVIQMVAAVASAVGAWISYTIGFANLPSWVLPSSIGVLVGLFVSFLAQRFFNPKARDLYSNLQDTVVPEAAAQLIPELPVAALNKTAFLQDENPKATYKNKLYLTFSNTSGEALIVGPKVKWIPNKLHNVIMENNCLWRVEDVRGDWTGETVNS